MPTQRKGKRSFTNTCQQDWRTEQFLISKYDLIFLFCYDNLWLLKFGGVFCLFICFLFDWVLFFFWGVSSARYYWVKCSGRCNEVKQTEEQVSCEAQACWSASHSVTAKPRGKKHKIFPSGKWRERQAAQEEQGCEKC